MFSAAITGSGVFTPEHTVTNDELVAAFNTHADEFNAAHAAEIEAGTVTAKPHSSSDFIVAASGIEQRYVLDKSGILDPNRMFPNLPARADDEPSLMAEMAVDAALQAMTEAGRSAADIDAVICAASNHERAYPAIAVEIQNLLEIDGFAFDMNVACSSATFGIQTATDMIPHRLDPQRAGRLPRDLLCTPRVA